jgi:hypothetical protein
VSRLTSTAVKGDVVTGFKNKVMSAAALFTPSDMLADQHRKKAEPVRQTNSLANN